MIKNYFVRIKTGLVAVITIIVVMSMVSVIGNKTQALAFHTPEELTRLHDMMQSQPYDTNTFLQPAVVVVAATVTILIRFH